MPRVLTLVLAVGLTLGPVTHAGAVVLYGSAFSGPTGPAILYHISPTTGAATAIGPIGFARVGSLDFSPVDGKLYGIGSNGGSAALITINPGTGAGTPVGPLGFIAGVGIYDIAFRPSDGRLFGLAQNALPPLNSVPVNLYTINTTTGAATLLGALGTQPPGLGGNGLAFLGGTLFYAAGGVSNIPSHAALYTLNQSTGSATLQTALTFQGNFGGANSVPRPAGMKFDRGTGILWTVAIIGSGPVGEADTVSTLATIATNSGVVTAVGPTQVGMDAIAVVSDVVTGVPTLSSWAQLVLVAALVVIAVAALRRRRVAA